MERSEARWQFLGDLFTTAIESYPYGWFYVDEYKWEDRHPRDYFAVIVEEEDKKETFRVTPETMATGLNKWRNSGKAMPKDLAEANRTNGDDGDYDAIDALAVLEYALFGKVVYV